MTPSNKRAWRIREICNWLIETEQEDWRENDCPDNHIVAHALIIKHGLPYYNRLKKDIDSE